LKEVAESLSVPLQKVFSAHALFKEYAAQRGAATAVASSLCGPEMTGELDRAQFELLVKEFADMEAELDRSDALRNAFEEADTNGNGSISFEEFAEWLCKHSFSEFMIVDRLSQRGENRALAKELGMTLLQVEDLRVDYRKYDENGDGTIDKNEFMSLLGDRLHVRLQDIPASRVQHWWRCADANMDGTISFQEFAKFHHRFFGQGETPLDSFYHLPGFLSLLRTSS
jgi:Ca2+-binding EF-hand superfamily protein